MGRVSERRNDPSIGVKANRPVVDARLTEPRRQVHIGRTTARPADRAIATLPTLGKARLRNVAHRVQDLTR